MSYKPKKDFIDHMGSVIKFTTKFAAYTTYYTSQLAIGIYACSAGALGHWSHFAYGGGAMLALAGVKEGIKQTGRLFDKTESSKNDNNYQSSVKYQKNKEHTPSPQKNKDMEREYSSPYKSQRNDKTHLQNNENENNKDTKDLQKKAEIWDKLYAYHRTEFAANKEDITKSQKEEIIFKVKQDMNKFFDNEFPEVNQKNPFGPSL